MSKQNRWSRIIDLCQEKEAVTIDELVKLLEASPATIRRDLQEMEDLYFDVSFVGTNGIHEQVGFTTSNELEAETKTLAIQHSRNPYIIADHTKFNQLCPVPLSLRIPSVIFHRIRSVT